MKPPVAFGDGLSESNASNAGVSISLFIFFCLIGFTYKKEHTVAALLRFPCAPSGFRRFCSEQVAHAEECVVHVHGTARHSEILSVGFRQSYLGANAEGEFSVVGMETER